ncbi:MAG: RNA-binding transcriptional accessory protein [Magnetococcales bacterium]|nr:RNA-binding transcriptional accessory protein [Magnetococcales bacterium]
MTTRETLPSSDALAAEKVNRRLAEEIGVHENQVAAAVQLLDEGATVPFIARYRKEVTGGLTDDHLRTLSERLGQLRELADRRISILNSIRQQGKLTAELETAILEADTRTRLEDLYLPYRPKRSTKAAKAREAGLEPLAMMLLNDPTLVPEKAALPFVNAENGVADGEAALEGAHHILAEILSEEATLIGQVRTAMWENGVMQSRLVKGKEEEGEKFSDYFAFDQPAKKLPAHRILALLRGKNAGVLRLGLEHAQDLAATGKTLTFGESLICQHFSIQNKGRPGDAWLLDVVHDTWLKKLKPHTVTDLIKQLEEKAQDEAVRVFSANLRDLLLAAPAGMVGVIGLDPGLRTGVKVAVVDKTGKVEITTTLYPHPPKNQWQEAKRNLALLAKKFAVRLVAIGNGTGSRETVRLVAEVKKEHPELNIEGVLVSEAGASVYSASAYASKELPDMDVSLRGAVSIARRLQDPLAELVKIDPKSIGVGQYQHDVDPKRLSVSLDGVVEDAVNAVGVDVNTASPPLLQRVSGLNATLAENIVSYREKNGPFPNRRSLNKVPRFGNKTFELAAGFLRIHNGDTPLDNSAVHPESYELVEKILQITGLPLTQLIGNQKVLKSFPATKVIDGRFGEPTVKDILQELEKPGRDPRPVFQTATFKEGVEDLKDLQPGMILEGVVSNVTNFGAFVDIGVHQDGLVHISVMADHFVKNPHSVVRAGEIVKVRVVEIDVKRRRIALSMRLHDPMEPSTQPKRDAPYRPQSPKVSESDLSDNAMAAAFSKAIKRP